MEVSKEKYTYKNKTYVILGFETVKCRVSREWYDAVKYIQLESGLSFIRESKEFFKLFKTVE